MKKTIEGKERDIKAQYVIYVKSERVGFMVKKYKIRARLVIDIETDLEDTETPNSETMEFLVADDLQDLGYDINYTKVTGIEVKEID